MPKEKKDKVVGDDHVVTGSGVVRVVRIEDKEGAEHHFLSLKTFLTPIDASVTIPVGEYDYTVWREAILTLQKD